MSGIDSEVVFQARCEAIGISAVTFNNLKNRGWATFGSYAFSVTTNPGQLTDADFDTKVAIPVLGAIAHPDAARLRRLLFESYTVTASELKRKTESSESDAPKKLPVQEVAARFTALEQKLAPLTIGSVLEPSHSLINSLAQCLEDGRLRYIEWSKCTSRTAELNNLKENHSLKVWKADSAGNIKQSQPESSLSCEVSSELDVLNALKRRGAAYEISKLMSYEEHEKIINLLFFELQKEPLEGFKKVSISQVAAADREIHTRLAELTRAGLPLGPRGELPLDVHINTVLAMPSIMWLLMPKPKSSGSDKPAVSNASKEKSPKKPQNEKKKSSLNLKRDYMAKKRKMPMPSQLRGGTPVDDEGNSICYGYNLGTCHDKDCKKGRHVCCAKGCFSTSHIFLNHRKAGA